MRAGLLTPPTSPAPLLSASAIAALAVAAMRAEADLTPKPGLVDGRGPGAHTDMDQALLHRSAEALRGALTECAQAARRSVLGAELRARLGVIGRDGERVMLLATGGVNTHRGALWALGLLSAGFAVAGQVAGAVDIAAQLARTPDPVLAEHGAVATSNGARARRRYGIGGAAGEAQLGFPHVRLHALPTLWAARRSGADESTARLEALLALMARVEDSCLLHRGGLDGLTAVRRRAAAVLAAGGYRSPSGQHQFAALDALCRTRRLSPGGSGDLLSAALFLDALQRRTPHRCQP